MPKWYKYLIVVAIAIFAICIMYDALTTEKLGITTELGQKEVMEIWDSPKSVSKTDMTDWKILIGAACLFFFMGGIVVVLWLANEIIAARSHEKFLGRGACIAGAGALCFPGILALLQAFFLL